VAWPGWDVAGRNTVSPYDATLPYAAAEHVPTIHRENGFRFYFYSNDHPPPHVHVEVGDSVAKLLLDPPQVDDAGRVSQRDLAQALAIVRRERDKFKQAWDDYFKA